MYFILYYIHIAYIDVHYMQIKFLMLGLFILRKLFYSFGAFITQKKIRKFQVEISALLFIIRAYMIESNKEEGATLDWVVMKDFCEI